MNNKQLQQRRSNAVPRGVATAMPFYAARAENAELWDVEGKRYIDFAGGIAVLNTGHRHPKVMAAVDAQMQKFTHTAFQVVAYDSLHRTGRAAEQDGARARIRRRRSSSRPAPRRSRTPSRSRATTPTAPRSIAFIGAFHGRTNLTMAMTGKVQPYKVGGPFAAEIYHVPFPNPLHGVTVEDSLKALQMLFKADVDPARVACIVIEPVQGEGGFYIAPTGFPAGAAQDLRRAQDPPDRRRGAVRHRAHRQDVRHRA